MINIEQYLVDIIKRMNTKDVPKPWKPWKPWCDSSQSVSWKAHREIETLNDTRFFPYLLDYISTEKNKNNRNAAYFFLGKLLIKANDNTVVQFYIDRLLIEADKYIIHYMLDRLADIHKDQSIDISPIIQHTKSDKWLIRHSAIRALAKTQHEIAKETIRAIVQLNDHKKNKYEIIYANAVLGMIGEKEDIDLLKPLFSSRIRDIKGSAKFAVEELEKPS